MAENVTSNLSNFIRYCTVEPAKFSMQKKILAVVVSLSDLA
jgi:hypothetical protein